MQLGAIWSCGARVGEVIFRFFLGSMYRHRKFSGDPHPGNLLRRPDGKVAFLDFGLFKQIGREPVEFALDVLRAVTEEDEAALHRLLAGEGFLPYPSHFDPTELMSYMLDAYWWCTTADRDVTITSEIAKGVVAKHLGPRSSNLQTTRQMGVSPPADRRAAGLRETQAIPSERYRSGPPVWIC